MKPYKTIKNAKKVIDELKNELPYSKNELRDAKRINTLLDALKSFDDMLVYKYKTDAVETLIYTLFYEYLLMYKAYEKEIPLENIIYNIDLAIFNGSEQKKLEVISILKAHELENKINNNSVFVKDYINFDILLKDLTNQIKQSIVWSLIK